MHRLFWARIARPLLTLFRAPALLGPYPVPGLPEIARLDSLILKLLPRASGGHPSRRYGRAALALRRLGCTWSAESATMGGYGEGGHLPGWVLGSLRHWNLYWRLLSSQSTEKCMEECRHASRATRRPRRPVCLACAARAEQAWVLGARPLRANACGRARDRRRLAPRRACAIAGARRAAPRASPRSCNRRRRVGAGAARSRSRCPRDTLVRLGGFAPPPPPDGRWPDTVYTLHGTCRESLHLES